MVEESATQRRQLVAANIKLRRAQIGMTQRTLAALMQVDQTNLSAWENARHEPTQSNLERLGAALDVPWFWFFMPHEEGLVG